MSSKKPAADAYPLYTWLIPDSELPPDHPRLLRRQEVVIASPAMSMQVGELDAWARHRGLSYSLSFSDRVYCAELRQPLGDGRSVAVAEAKAADAGVALVAAAQNYERLYAQRTS